MRPLQVALHRPPAVRRVLCFIRHLHPAARAAPRGASLAWEKAREREQQHIRHAERGAPSAAELLTLHESELQPPTSYDGPPGSPSSAYHGTVRPRLRSERHFSASTPPSSSYSHSSSSGHGHTNGETLQRTPNRLGADGPLTARLSGWFAHLAGSTSDLSLASTISGALSHSVTTATALPSSTTRRGNKDASSNSGGSERGGASKTSLLDKAALSRGGRRARPQRGGNMVDGRAATGLGVGGRGARRGRCL